jgi:sigma-B regulation protein RsbU (phosphoserine phosphatase)
LVLGVIGLLFLGRDQLPGSTLLVWVMAFGGTTAVAVLLVSLYRVQVELRESRHELARKEAELSFALEVQTALFPKELPKSSGLSFSAVCIPAQGISGDFYDIFECPDGRVVVAVADVSGKGVSAAILMANLQAQLRVHTKQNSSLSEVFKTLNEDLYAVTESSRFATAFLAQWDPSRQRLNYVNAGHSSPVLLSSQENGMLDRGGTPLGMFPGIQYDCGEVNLQPSDIVVLYSDGITEAACADGEEFGLERLTELVEGARDRPVGEIRDMILAAVRQWVGNELELHDDMTLVIFEVEEPELAASRRTEGKGEDT